MGNPGNSATVVFHGFYARLFRLPNAKILEKHVRNAGHTRTYWNQFRDIFQTEEGRQSEGQPPEVLLAFPASERVLHEIADEEKYQLVVRHALKRSRKW